MGSVEDDLLANWMSSASAETMAAMAAYSDAVMTRYGDLDAGSSRQVGMLLFRFLHAARD